MTLAERYQSLLSRPDPVDTHVHLPLFHSLTGHILEIGCDVGNSTTAFLCGPSLSVTSIDINPRCADNFPAEAASGRWRFIAGDSRALTTINQLTGELFDVLFIDGGHDYETVRSDLSLYSLYVRLGGLILVHDVCCPDTFPGVRRAFGEFTPGKKSVREESFGLGVIQL
jgi:predicted O-methyltransferase YrrM